jgi:response regulator RpfG family c-di-GMP phosphodiesterase
MFFKLIAQTLKIGELAYRSYPGAIFHVAESGLILGMNHHEGYLGIQLTEGMSLFSLFPEWEPLKLSDKTTFSKQLNGQLYVVTFVPAGDKKTSIVYMLPIEKQQPFTFVQDNRPHIQITPGEYVHTAKWTPQQGPLLTLMNQAPQASTIEDIFQMVANELRAKFGFSTVSLWKFDMDKKPRMTGQILMRSKEDNTPSTIAKKGNSYVLSPTQVESVYAINPGSGEILIKEIPDLLAYMVDRYHISVEEVKTAASKGKIQLKKKPHRILLLPIREEVTGIIRVYFRPQTDEAYMLELANHNSDPQPLLKSRHLSTLSLFSTVLKTAIAKQDDIVLSNVESRKEVQKVIHALILLSIELSAIHHQETGPHLKRVRHKSYELLKEMVSANFKGVDISKGDRKLIDRLGIELISDLMMLHDIGKIGIPNRILSNTTPTLSPEDWEMVKKHPKEGEEIIEKILRRFSKENRFLRDTFRVLREIVGGHHEDYDGGGYPSGLKGQKISFFARFARVIDTHDALADNRSYDAAWDAQKMIRFFQEKAGERFDPGIVDMMLSVDEKLHKIDKKYTD